jgi:hypothetical protein
MWVCSILKLLNFVISFSELEETKDSLPNISGKFARKSLRFLLELAL